MYKTINSQKLITNLIKKFLIRTETICRSDNISKIAKVLKNLEKKEKQKAEKKSLSKKGYYIPTHQKVSPATKENH